MKYFLPLILIANISIADNLYVDTTSSNCSTYDPGTRSCVGGTETNYNSLSAGLNVVSPGDTLFLRQGTYGQLNIQNSGSIGQPITIKGYQNETATITSSGDPGIYVINKANIVIDNLTVTNSIGFGRLENSNRITVQNSTFRNAGASGTTGALKLVRSTYNKIYNNSFADGSDLFILQDNSNWNVVQSNNFGDAAHSLISIRCANENIIRDNEFDNSNQKAVELYDCEGVSDAPVRLDAAKRNLFEYNRFYGTRASSQSHNYNAMQHGAQQTIVRYNVYTDNLGGGINYQEYGQESLYVYENRMYNNTFYNNRCYAIIGQSGSNLYDNRVVNNLLYQNTNCSGGGSSQVSISNSSTVILTNNTQATSNPGFVDASNKNFNLVASSNQINAGIPVAKTISAGSGNIVEVDDSGWFYDGYGIESERGDIIRIGDRTAEILDIVGNSITINNSLIWTANQGVHLDYSGSAPDIGAFEYMEEPTPTPNAPSNLRMN
jgi:hypothetical protein